MEKPFDNYLFPIRLFGAVFIFFGVSALFDLIVGLFTDACILHLHLAALPIGIGLLNHNKQAIPWAVFFSWLGIILGPVKIIFLLFVDSEIPVPLSGIPSAVSTSKLLVSLLLIAKTLYSLWQRYVLTRPIVRQTFETQSASPPSSSWWPVLVILSFFALFVYHGSAHIHRKTLRSAYACRVYVEAYDAATGEPLNPFVSQPYSKLSISKEDVVLSSVTSVSNIDPPQFRLSVVAFRPVTFTVGAEGYAAKEFTIDEAGDEKLIRAALRRIPSTEPNTTGPDGTELIISRICF